MNKEAHFYILNINDDYNLAICKIIKKYYLSGCKILVHIDEMEIMKNLDTMLWTFEQTSFIPHSTDKQIDVCPDVLLCNYNDAKTSINNNSYNIFFNLTSDMINLDKFDKTVLEVVDTNKANKDLARRKYLYYKNNNIMVKHINL